MWALDQIQLACPHCEIAWESDTEQPGQVDKVDIMAFHAACLCRYNAPYAAWAFLVKGITWVTRGVLGSGLQNIHSIHDHALGQRGTPSGSSSQMATKGAPTTNLPKEHKARYSNRR